MSGHIERAAAALAVAAQGGVRADERQTLLELAARAVGELEQLRADMAELSEVAGRETGDPAEVARVAEAVAAVQGLGVGEVNGLGLDRLEPGQLELVRELAVGWGEQLRRHHVTWVAYNTALLCLRAVGSQVGNLEPGPEPDVPELFDPSELECSCCSRPFEQGPGGGYVDGQSPPCGCPCWVSVDDAEGPNAAGYCEAHVTESDDPADWTEVEGETVCVRCAPAYRAQLEACRAPPPSPLERLVKGVAGELEAKGLLDPREVTEP